MKNSLMPHKGNRLFSKPTSDVPRGVSVTRRSMPGLGEYAALGLPPFASKNDVKSAYKRLALKYHPDVVRDVNGHEKAETFKEIKSAYESLMAKFEEEKEEEAMGTVFEDEWEEWDEWMGFEGGTPVIFNPLDFSENGNKRIGLPVFAQLTSAFSADLCISRFLNSEV